MIDKDVYIPIGNRYKDHFNAFLEKHYLGNGEKRQKDDIHLFFHTACRN